MTMISGNASAQPDGDAERLPDAELLPYLDWPTDWDDQDVWCARPDCTIGDCGNDNPESRVWITSRYALTPRSLAEGIRRHALDGPRPPRCSGWAEFGSNVNGDIRVECGREPHDWSEDCTGVAMATWGGD
jgi:hypothetical protein